MESYKIYQDDIQTLTSSDSRAGRPPCTHSPPQERNSGNTFELMSRGGEYLFEVTGAFHFHSSASNVTSNCHDNSTNMTEFDKTYNVSHHVKAGKANNITLDIPPKLADNQMLVILNWDHRRDLNLRISDGKGAFMFVESLT